MEDQALERRGIRTFTGRPVSVDDVGILIRVGLGARSAGGERPCHFVVIRERSLLDAAATFLPHPRLVRQAPLSILVCGDPGPGAAGRSWAEACSAATGNILIKAEQIGLSAVSLGIYPRADHVRDMRRIISGMPAHVVPFALVLVGYQADCGRQVRWDDRRVHFGCW